MLSLLNLEQRLTVRTTVTSYSDRVYYQTFMHGVAVANGQNSEMVHHYMLLETWCVGRQLAA